MNKLFSKIAALIAGLSLVIGVGFAMTNNNRITNKVEAAAGDAADGSWTRITATSDINTTDDFLLGWNYSGTDYFTNGTVTSKGLNTTSTVSSAKLIRFETTTGGYYIKHTSSNYINNASGTDMSLGSKSSVWTIDSDLYVVNTSNSNRFLGAASESASARIKAYASNNKGSYPQVFVYKRATPFGTLDHIKISTPATKLSFLTGETFSSSGLVLTGYDGENEATASQQTYYSGYVTNYDGHTFVKDEVGERTVTITYEGKTATYTINVVASPDFVHTYASNSVFESETYSTTETNTYTPESGPEYITLGGYNYAKGSTMSFRNTAGMYLGNNDFYRLESVKKNIAKIVIETKEDVHGSVQMTEGLEPLSETTTITPDLSNSNKTLTYIFSGNNPFFKFKSTAATYINMLSIKVYLGSDAAAPEVDTVSASIKDGTYYVGDQLSASDFNVTVTWTLGKDATHPTSGFTWTVNGDDNGTLIEGNNSVILTYEGVNSTPFNVVAEVPSAKYVIEHTLTTNSSLSYSNYAKDSNDINDTLNRGITGVTESSYGTWTWNSTYSSGITYKGRSAGGNESIQLRASDNSGIVVNANTGNRCAKHIVIEWDSHTADERSVEIYGKNESYSLASELYNDSKKGTLLGTSACSDQDENSKTTFVINGSYIFIGIKSAGNALYIKSLEIQWNRTTFTYENLAIRFGGRIEADLWTRLNTESSIQGYGVLLSTYEYLNAQVEKDLKNYFESADGINVKKFTNADTYPDHELKAEPTLKDGYRVWNLYKQVRLEDATKDYVGVAFIQINGEVVFLNSLRTSVKKLAQALIAGPERDENSLGGSLNYLANL